MLNFSNLNFPIICFNKYTFNIINSLDQLTLTTKAGLKNGLFENLIIIDSNGLKYRVKEAKKLYGVGPLWGYNIFLNQKIKVTLDFQSEVKSVTIQELMKLIISNFNKDKHFWESRDDFDELKRMVECADSIPSLIARLGEILNTEYK